MKENWGELEKAINDLEEGEKDELKDHFEAAVPGLGEVLFGGEFEEFENKI